jgi:hypothetical protein
VIWYWELRFDLVSCFWSKNAFIYLFVLDLEKESAGCQSEFISSNGDILDRSFRFLPMEWSASVTKMMKAYNLNESLDRHFPIDFKRRYLADLVHLLS